MKKHVALVIAAVVVAYTILIDVRFVRFMHRAMDLQAISKIHIPTDADREAARREYDGMAKLYIASDSAVYEDGKKLDDDGLRQFVRANLGKRILVRAEREANYSEVKDLMTKFRAWGVKDVVWSVVNH